jgi:hypothetical protein
MLSIASPIAFRALSACSTISTAWFSAASSSRSSLHKDASGRQASALGIGALCACLHTLQGGAHTVFDLAFGQPGEHIDVGS